MVWSNLDGANSSFLSQTPSENLETTLQALVDGASKYTVTVPSRLVTVGSWTGAVWSQEQFTSNSAQTGWMIWKPGEATAHGGYVGGSSSPLSITTDTNHNISITLGDPVNVRDGGLSDDEQDLSIPSPGLPLALARHYSSTLPSDQGMGIGWMNTYSQFINVTVPGNISKITWTTAEGTVHEFRRVNGTYALPDELHGTVTATGTDFIYQDTNGTTFDFDISNYYLKSITDRDGNAITIAHDAQKRITTVTASASGQSLTFGYDATSHITTVTDSTGRVWTYTYQSMVNPTTSQT
jgi:YD repeat-containing protein